MPQRRSATALRRVAEGESTRTVVIALLSNVAIAVAKLIGGLLSGSTGLLAEAAHSAATACPFGGTKFLFSRPRCSREQASFDLK
jgi:Co/Zn/Cd efflux system component